MNTSEVLNKAADLIEERGWAKGNCGMLAAPSGPLCLEGAIGHVVGANTVYRSSTSVPAGVKVFSYSAIQAHPAYAAVQAYLNQSGYRHAWQWNDEQTSAGRVIEVLRAAAVIEAAKENASAEVAQDVAR